MGVFMEFLLLLETIVLILVSIIWLWNLYKRYFTKSSLNHELNLPIRNSYMIIYASQTGTAETFAERLYQELSDMPEKLFPRGSMMDIVELFSLEELYDISKRSFVIFILSTFGDGGPTDSAISFSTWLKNASEPLDMHYSIFGLGDSQYEEFNNMSIFVDSKLKSLQSTCYGDIGMGDSSKNIEQDFLCWKQQILWPKLCSFFSISLSHLPLLGVTLTCHYKLVLSPSAANIFKGEHVIVSKKKKKIIYESKYPYYGAKVVKIEKLNKDSPEFGSYYQVLVDLSDSDIHYRIGDHLGIYPQNDLGIVKSLGKRLCISNMDEIFEMKSIKSSFHSFPTPCSFRTAFTHYIAIQSPPSMSFLYILGQLNKDTCPVSASFLTELGQPGHQHYQSYILDAGRNILDVLLDHPDINVPLELFLERMPRLSCRYYSISSSPRATASNLVYITIKETLFGEYKKRIGVATGFMTRSLLDSPYFSVFVRHVPSFKLPHTQSTSPIIMICTGAGIAPFIGFLQERQFIQVQCGKRISSAYLFFGCRHPEMDYLYKERIEKWIDDGILNDVYLAFSRVPDNSSYIQSRLIEKKEMIIDLIIQKHGIIYICGDAKKVGKSVYQTMIEILSLDLVKKLKKEERYNEDTWSS